jgi:hypothetical protein
VPGAAAFARLCNAKREQRWHASAYGGIEIDNSRPRKIAEPAGPPGRMTKFESLVNSNENTDGFYASARVT